jgi:catalase
VLFDAVAILPSKEGSARLADLPAARDFIADAVAHQKFIAYISSAAPLLEKAAAKVDDGFIRLDKPKDCADFVARCRNLRFWERAAE